MDEKLARVTKARLEYYDLLKESTEAKLELYRSMRNHAMELSDKLEGLVDLAKEDVDFYNSRCRKANINFNVWDSRVNSVKRDITKIEKAKLSLRLLKSQ